MGAICKTIFAFALATFRRYAGRHEGDAWVVAGNGVSFAVANIGEPCSVVPCRYRDIPL